MTDFDIPRQRLHHQGIAPAVCQKPGQAVRLLGAIQAQDYAGVLWAVGLRTREAVEADIEAAITSRQIVRTWLMRGTLHLVAPDDVRWMLALLAPRVIAGSARRYRQLNLDKTTFARSEALFAEALRGGRQLTRSDLLAVLEQGGVSTVGQRGYYILRWAGLRGLICFGPRQGKAETFVWLADRPSAGSFDSREAALAELTRRYFTGHGPATIQDFMWWSGLTATDARAGLALLAEQLAQETVDGQTFWFSPSVAAETASPIAHLLPAFDEYVLGYKARSAVLEPAYAKKVVPGGGGMVKPIIVIDGRIVGIWQRTLKKDRVAITLQPFDAFSEAEHQAVVAAAERYSEFIGLPAMVS